MGCALTFDPSGDDWTRIGEAYPYLSEADRKTITGFANEYLSLAQFEQNAPRRDDVVAWLEAMEKSARTFRESISDEGDFGKVDAIFHAQIYVMRRIDHPAFNNLGAAKWRERSRRRGIKSQSAAFKGSNAAKWRELRTIIESVVSAFAVARRDMLKEADAGFVRFVEGESWDAMVCHLTEWAKGKDYPIGASKGANKSKSGKPSDFVAFVRELQRIFPKEYQHHMTSDDALAKAIGDARKNSCAGP